MSAPLEIRLGEARDCLEIRWDDGSSSHLPAVTLRAASRAAGALRAALDGEVPEFSNDLRIIDVKQVGTYAINLFFNDGHDRGIYPWALLHALGDDADGKNISAPGN